MHKKTTLKNGIRLITVPMKSTKTAAVIVLVGTGSKNETREKRGISHFLEHMFFKGTKKRPTALDISKELDQVGGVYNAFTSKEYTGFWAKVDSRHSDLALDVISDMLLNSKFSEDEIKREKKTIIEEINMYVDNPSMYILSLFENLLYRNQSLGYDTLGSKKTVASIKRDDFIKYYKKYYNGKNIVVAVAGNIKEEKIRDRIKKYFHFTCSTKARKEIPAYDKQTKPNVLLKYKKTDQAHLCLGVRGYGINHKDKYALDILSTILGGNMSSRLFISVREREGLAYSIQTFTENYSDVGYLVTQAGVNNKKCLRAIRIILDEYKRVKEEKISEEEIEKAKNYLKGKAVIALESPDAVAGFVANQEISTGKILTLKEKFDKIDKVTAKDLQRVAREVFVNNKLNLALIGPFENKKTFERILEL